MAKVISAMLHSDVEKFHNLTTHLTLILSHVSRYDLLIAHKEELGQLITLEQGKPLKEALGEVSV